MKVRVRVRAKECIMSKTVLTPPVCFIHKPVCVSILFGHFAFQSLDRQHGSEMPLSCDHLCVLGCAGVCVGRSCHMSAGTKQDTFHAFRHKAP